LRPLRSAAEKATNPGYAGVSLFKCLGFYPNVTEVQLVSPASSGRRVPGGQATNVLRFD
jgi:hypothetical protein